MGSLPENFLPDVLQTFMQHVCSCQGQGCLEPQPPMAYNAVHCCRVTEPLRNILAQLVQARAQFRRIFPQLCGIANTMALQEFQR